MTQTLDQRPRRARPTLLPQRSVEQLERAMAQARMGWFERDLRTNLCIGSPSIGQIFGLGAARRSWTYDELRALIVPEDRDRHARQVEITEATRTSDIDSHTFDYRIQRPDGEIRHIEVRYGVVVDAQRSSVYALVFDVTETRLIEESVRAGKAWLDLAVDSARMVLWELRPDTGEFRASDNCNEFFGLPDPLQPPSVTSLMEQVHPDDRPRVEASYRALCEHGAAFAPNFRVVTSRGRTRWMSSRGRLYHDESYGARLVGVTWDTTAEQEAAVALAAEFASEQRLARVAEMIPGAIYQACLAPDGSFAMSYCSEGIRQLCGLTPKEVERDPAVFPRRLHRDDLKSLILSTHHSAANMSLWRLEFRMHRGDGSWCWVLGQAMPVREADGAVVWHGHLLDITERKAAEEERERLNAQLRQAQKMEAIGLLTGGIAHDFNNILASILGYSGLALRRYGAELPEKLAEYLREIQTAGERARDLTAQLLAFSRGRPAAASAVDVAELLEQSMRMLRPTLPSSIQVQVDIASKLPSVLADPVQLQQVIVNLCINARDAMVDSGRLTLRLRRHHFTNATCASCHGDFAGDYMVLTIGDDGPGIPPSTRERIFEPFFSTKAPTRGTGMGLAMVHGIVHNHAGHIMLCDGDSGGACFDILLPVPEQPVPAPVTAHELPGTLAPRPVRILVIDDEPAVSAYLADLLELAGYVVQRETDARRALGQFLEAPSAYDLIVTDQTMPYLTGGQFAQAVLTVRTDIPIVIMTGYSATLDEARAAAIGVRAFLHKPVSSSALLDTVAALVAPPD